MEYYSQAIAIEPDEAKNYYARANCYRDLGITESAFADYDEAIRLNPLFQYSFCNRGDLHRRLKHLDLAEKDFLTAISLDPTDDAPLYNLALINMDRKDYAKAIQVFDRYLKIKPEDGTGYFTRGYARMLLLSEKITKNKNDFSAILEMPDVYDDMKKALSFGETKAEELMSIFSDGTLKDLSRRPL